MVACLSVWVPAALYCHGNDLSWNRCSVVRTWHDRLTQASSQDALAPWRRVLPLLFRFLYSLLPCVVLGIRAAPTLAQVCFTGCSRLCPEVISSRLAVAKQDWMRLCRMVRVATNGECRLTSSEDIVIQGDQVGGRVQKVVILRIVSTTSGVLRETHLESLGKHKGFLPTKIVFSRSRAEEFTYHIVGKLRILLPDISNAR